MSLRGMTGFARRDGSVGEWIWTAEARSVNGRTLEVRVRVSSGLEGQERPAREAAQARFQRGQVGIVVQARRTESAGVARIHHEVIERYLEAVRHLIESGQAVAPSADAARTSAIARSTFERHAPTVELTFARAMRTSLMVPL